MNNQSDPKIKPNKPEHPEKSPGPMKPSIPRRVDSPSEKPRTAPKVPDQNPEELPVRKPERKES